MTQKEMDEKEFEEWWKKEFPNPKLTFHYPNHAKKLGKCGWLASRRLLREKEGKDG